MGHVGHRITLGILDQSHLASVGSLQGQEAHYLIASTIAHSQGQLSLYQKVRLSSIYTDHTSTSQDFYPSQNTEPPPPTPLPASGIPRPGTNLGAPTYQPGSRSGPPSAWGPWAQVPGSGEGQVDRFPKIQQVPLSNQDHITVLMIN